MFRISLRFRVSRPNFDWQLLEKQPKNNRKTVKKLEISFNDVILILYCFSNRCPELPKECFDQSDDSSTFTAWIG